MVEPAQVSCNGSATDCCKRLMNFAGRREPIVDAPFNTTSPRQAREMRPPTSDVLQSPIRAIQLGPDPGQPDKEAIRRAQSRPGHRPFVHGELLAEGEVFDGELTMAAAEEGRS